MVREHAPSPSADRRWRALPVAAGLLFACLALDAARTETPTIDEFAHVAAAHALLVHGRSDLYAKSPPLGRALLALPSLADASVRTPLVREQPFGWGPWQYGYRFMMANAGHYLSIFTRSRAVVVALSLATAWLLFLWARSLFGERAAAITTALLLTTPTLLAHGHLATLDVASTGAIFASAFALRWACGEGGGAGRVALAGLVWGIALLVKFTAVLLLPAFALLLALRHVAAPGDGRGWGRAAGHLALLSATALLVVNAGMGFRGSFTALSDYPMASGFGKQAQRLLPGALPVPLPWDYVRGFDAQKLDVENAEFPSYALGTWRREGVWWYEGLALLLKTPLPLLALLAATPFVLWRRPMERRELLFAALPLLSLGILLTAFNSLNVGIRYLLPLHPFALLLLAALFRDAASRAWSAFGAGAVAWQVAVAAAVHPGYLAYFNLAAGGPSQGHRYLLDSNYDWGQDLYRLPAALEELGVGEPVALLYFGHVAPSLYGIEHVLPPSGPFEGIVAASVTYVKGFAYPAPGPDGRPTRVGRDSLAWLEGREPVRRLGSIWIYDTRSAR